MRAAEYMLATLVMYHFARSEHLLKVRYTHFELMSPVMVSVTKNTKTRSTMNLKYT